MTWHIPECPRPSPVHPALAGFLHQVLWQPWLSQGVRLQAPKGEASCVAVILVLDERPGKRRGSLCRANRCPQATSLCLLELRRQQCFHPKDRRGSEATALGELQGIGSSQPPNRVHVGSSQHNLVLAAHQLGKLCQYIRPPLQPVQKHLQASKKPVQVFLLLPTSQLLSCHNLTATPLSFWSLRYRQRSP